MREVTTLEPDPLAECFQAYRALDAPGYALLVTGAWGVGKTRQVHDLLLEGQQLFVSLFGPATADEVHAAVLAAAFPTEHHAKEALGAVTGGGPLGTVVRLVSGGGSLAATAGLVSGFGAAVLRRRLKAGPDRVLVFDDLERSSLPVQVLLGVINEYVEHRSFHVVLIADLNELKGARRRRFDRFREKLVGRTVAVTPQVEPAFDAFLKRLRDEGLQGDVACHRNAILEAFERSGARSLRHLRTVIDAVARLLAALAPRHREREEGVNALVRLFAALVVEVANGALSAADLAQRITSWDEVHELPDDDIQEKRFDAARRRHPAIDLHDPLLPRALTVELLIHGRFHAGALAAVLDADARFVPPEKAPAWPMVLNHPRFPEEGVEAATRRMLDAFEAREYVDTVDLLHVFAIRLRMARIGHPALGRTAEEAHADNLRCIDDLYKDDRLPAAPRDDEEPLNPDRDVGGRSFMINEPEEKDRLREARLHLEDRMERTREERLPLLAWELMETLRADPGRFANRIAETYGGRTDSSTRPVLRLVPHKDFVDLWLDGRDIGGWWTVRDALEERYLSPSSGTLLEDERKWIGAVIEEQRTRIDQAVGWRQDRIRSATPWKLAARLRRDASSDATTEPGARADGPS